MTEFYVGQKVWCNDYDSGVVEGIYRGETFPVVVKFNSGTTLSFTSDGRYCVEGDVVLFTYPAEDSLGDESTKPTLDWKDSPVERPKGETI